MAVVNVCGAVVWYWWVVGCWWVRKYRLVHSHCSSGMCASGGVVELVLLGRWMHGRDPV